MQVKRVRGSGPARLPRARRTILHYVATCKECDELPESPRKATIHAADTGHRVIETKHYEVTQTE